MQHNSLNQVNKLNLTFYPHPLARNSHLQTIFSSYPRYRPNGLPAASREMVLTVEDGIRLHGFYAPQPESRGLHEKSRVKRVTQWPSSA